MDLQQNAVPIPDKPKAVYTAEDTVFAWLSLLLSFLYCQALPVTQNPLGGFLLILALFASGFVLIRLKKQPVSPICILSAVGGTSSLPLSSMVRLRSLPLPVRA